MVPIRYNLRSLFVRKTTTLATALGIGLVVFVLASALMLSSGITKTLATTGRADQAIVLRRGSDTELASSIETSMLGLVLAKPEVQAAAGSPVGAGELVVVLALDKAGDTDKVANVQVRGISSASSALRSEAKVIAGRAATPGTDEVMVGKGVAGRYRGVDLDQSFELTKNRPVKVVGVFEAEGSSLESEVWASLETLQSSFGREALLSSITVRLTSPSAFEAFRIAVEGDKQLGLEAIRESDYYEKHSRNTSLFVFAMGAIITFFFSLGAMIGAMITMMAAVSQRQREIGTLRALGFSRGAILVSFLAETVLLAMIGGIAGILGALAVSSTKISMMNFATWQEVRFGFDADPKLLLVSLILGCGIGVLGGFIPAVRATRVQTIEAIRA